jgi:Flp pilus assembly protein TadG
MDSNLIDKPVLCVKKYIAFQTIARFSKLGKDCRGAAALEFALSAPFMITLMVGIMEIAMMSFSSALVEGAVRNASRFGITGLEVDGGVSRETAIIQQIQHDTLGMIEIDNSNIQTLVYPSFEDIGLPEPFNDTAPANGIYDEGETFNDINGNGQWDPDMGQAGAGGPGDVVVYRVSYEWPLMLGLLSKSFGSSIDLGASIAVRNEPYDG